MARSAGASKAYCTNELAMFQTQSKIISQLSRQGSCIFVDRCADYMPRNQPNVFRVFVHADKQGRVRRVVEDYGVVGAAYASGLIDAIDRNRAAYYHKYTQRTWGESSNYGMTLSSDELGISTCIVLLAEAITSSSQSMLPFRLTVIEPT